MQKVYEKGEEIMRKEQLMVRDFHQAFNIQVNNRPTLNVDQNVPILRCNLIQEELDEFKEAMQNNDLVEIADALGDLLYVVLGAAVTYGIDMQPVFAEIHKSNMTKVGGKQREDGKWLKPDTYIKPDLATILKDL